MVNTTGINAYIIYNCIKRTNKRPVDCHKFLVHLAKSLVKSWAEEQVSFPGQHTKTQQVIKSIFPELNSPARIPTNLTATKRCWLCPTKEDKKTRTPCINCKTV
ncbi:hypothetical protein Pmani_011396 [Petrolisthes manimaculis]|uniref:Uncharacterized protein n=1 Tax=Petrolisthes manimaculis TaxID=1843537 RepID=A0AAE1UB70_9EUCA|nr:hypothetical protein Pmani_011396 [Petrolisthes manimaculis]